MIGLVLFRQFEQDIDLATYNAMLGGLLILTVLFWRDPVPFAAIIATVLLAHHFVVEGSSTLTLRSFFGVMKVNETDERPVPDAVARHHPAWRAAHPRQTGQSRHRPARADDVLLRRLRHRAGHGRRQAVKGGPINYAVIGLGTGSLICRSQPGDKATYYEIDALMVRLVPRHGHVHLPQGMRTGRADRHGRRAAHARRRAGRRYDLIVVDAFTSDAIPIHLLTKEAMAIYKRKLSPNGIVLIHISNRHLELGSVVTGIAAANDMVTRSAKAATSPRTTATTSSSAR